MRRHSATMGGMTVAVRLRPRPPDLQLEVRQIALCGLAATLMIAAGSYGAGALPANDPTRKVPVLGLLRHGATGLHVALALYYLGLFLFVVTWLALGRVLLTGRPDGTSEADHQVLEPAFLRRMFTRWMLPLLFGMPLASMDLYSYAAQSQLAQHGLDPYTATPADLPGKFLDNVAWRWVDTPSPYGPLWVAVSRWAAALTGDHALISVLLLRLLPFASLLIIARLVPVLAVRFGIRPDLAVWLTVANPLMLVHGVGGGHNDVVMIMFMLAALCLVTRPEAGTSDLIAAAVLGALGGAVKFPGLVVVAFLIPMYFAGRSGLRLRDWVRACAGVALIAGTVFLVVSMVAGVGIGWIRQLTASTSVITFLSLPTMAAVGVRMISGAAHPSTVDHTVRDFRQVGSILSGAVLIGLWLRANRSAPMLLLSISLVTIVLLGPAVQPWYLLWALPCAALLPLRPPQVSWIAAASVALTVITRPMGSNLEMSRYVPAVVAAALASRALLGPVVHRHTAPARQARPAQSEVLG